VIEPQELKIRVKENIELYRKRFEWGSWVIYSC
jgi:hypothetical protein